MPRTCAASGRRRASARRSSAGTTRSSSTGRGPAPTRSTRSAGATSACPCTTSATSARGSRTAGRRDLPSDYLLATVGGGVDGYPLLSRFVEALRLRPLPLPAVVVTGPLMPAGRARPLRERAAGLDVRVEQFREDMDSVIVGARAVVSMAGYNTVSELLIAGKPGLIVPGLRPTQEQMMRAEMLAASGLVGRCWTRRRSTRRACGGRSIACSSRRLRGSSPVTIRAPRGRPRSSPRWPPASRPTPIARTGRRSPGRSAAGSAARGMSVPGDRPGPSGSLAAGGPHDWRRSVRLLRPFFTRNWAALGGASGGHGPRHRGHARPALAAGAGDRRAGRRARGRV